MEDEELNFNIKDLFGFLISRVIDLETESFVQRVRLKALETHLLDAETSQLLEDEAESARQPYRLQRQAEISEELKGLSKDFDDLIDDLLS